MSELPAGWEHRPLGDVCEVILGQSPPGSSYNEEGSGVPFFQGKAEFGYRHPTVRKWTTEGKKFAAAGDILISVRAPVGPTNVADVDCAIGRGLAALRAPSETIREYLLLALEATRERLASQATGSTFEAVSGTVIRSHLVPIAPDEEQERIVRMTQDLLERLDGAQRDLDDALKRAERLRTRIADELLERGGFPTVALIDVMDVFEDCPHRTPKYADDGLFPALRPRDVVGGQLDLTAAARVSRAEYERQSARHVLEAGDVVYSRELSYGWAAVIPEETGACLSQGMLALRPTEQMAAEFLALVLNSTLGRRQSQAAATGSAHPHVNLRDIRSFQLPLPSQSEQRAILASVRGTSVTISRLSTEITKSRARSKLLRSSVLSAAFSGRLTSQEAVSV